MCELSPCPKCECMTKSIRDGRAKYHCGKCKADKSLSDVYFYETTQKSDTMPELNLPPIAKHIRCITPTEEFLRLEKENGNDIMARKEKRLAQKSEIVPEVKG